MWSAAVFDPALPGRRRIANGSPVPGAPWSTNAHNGWNPKPFLFSALGRSGLRGGHQLAVLCRGSTGDLGEGWQAEVGRGCFQLFDLVELLACSDEADLQAVDLAEPALAPCLGDPRQPRRPDRRGTERGLARRSGR